MNDLYFVVEASAFEFNATSPRYRTMHFVGASYTQADLIKWAQDTFRSVPGNGEITTVEDAAKACQRGGWKVLKLL